MPPAMGRPACAHRSAGANTGRSALSLGCCGARAYLDVLTPEVALYAIPAHRGRVRRADCGAGQGQPRAYQVPSDPARGRRSGELADVRESLASLQAAG